MSLRGFLTILGFAIVVCVATTLPAAAKIPLPAHVIVVVEENHTLKQVIGDEEAPYLTALAKRSALFVQSFGVTHPSLPNYLALFAGITNSNGDGCPAIGFNTAAPNLASELLAAHRTFVGYSESLPQAGSKVCAAGTYARKHAPWVEFSNVPSSLNQPFSAFKLDALPTVAFVIPNVDDDMHDVTVRQGDDWARAHIDPIVRWADAHNSLVIITWDEGYDRRNSIPTLFVGPMVRAGRYTERIDHYNVLRTLEAMFALPLTGHAKDAVSIMDCWQ
jgi:phosphatidylinositol-3-phosphatase